ncbi:hypothetical protein TUBRATIS_22130 [Tubulinosema ratisbonensis]|uniref:Uncharacterized protein n=1 Tax=Tubulinosema ratisbonensis TaxID=291195 RepID=A0A437AJH9_9MICR|nr:hypothetical protein TUBRATIS_22130 [Tubulinosema ratisbonensis]
MILLKILANLEFVNKHKRKIQFIILGCCFYFLKIEKCKNKVLTDESLFDKMKTKDKLVLGNSKNLTEYNEFKTFSLNNMSPNDTILILGKKEDEFYFEKLIHNIKNAKVCTKNIKILLGEVNHTSLKCLYFCILKINFSDFNCTLIDPLRNWQPNSDLLFLTYDYFPPKQSLNLHFMNEFPLNVNFIEINITPSTKDLRTFLLYLRALHNIHSHSLGNYYYIPFENYHLSLLSLVPFLGCNFIFMLFSGFKRNMNISLKYFYPLIFYYFPFSFIFFITNDSIFNSYCSFIFVLFNFKIGLVYHFLIFLRNIFYFVFRMKGE